MTHIDDSVFSTWTDQPRPLILSLSRKCFARTSRSPEPNQVEPWWRKAKSWWSTLAAPLEWPRTEMVVSLAQFIHPLGWFLIQFNSSLWTSTRNLREHHQEVPAAAWSGILWSLLLAPRIETLDGVTVSGSRERFRQVVCNLCVSTERLAKRTGLCTLSTSTIHYWIPQTWPSTIGSWSPTTSR